VTVSWSYFHDVRLFVSGDLGTAPLITKQHWKTSLIGSEDGDGSEDKFTTVTYHHNYFVRVNSRTPSIRFGTGQ